MRLSQVETPEDAADWLAYLDGRWPQRRQVIDHILDIVRPCAPERTVELCCGVGALGAALLTALPGTYLGLDLTAVVLEAARRRLAPHGARAVLQEADLNGQWDSGWFGEGVGAVVSMQALHDLGGEAEVERAYARAASALEPGGLLLNADLIEGAGEKPGRLTPARHLDALRRCGLEQVECTLDDGVFACCIGRAP